MSLVVQKNCVRFDWSLKTPLTPLRKSFVIVSIFFTIQVFFKEYLILLTKAVYLQGYTECFKLCVRNVKVGRGDLRSRFPIGMWLTNAALRQ